MILCTSCLLIFFNLEAGTENFRRKASGKVMLCMTLFWLEILHVFYLEVNHSDIENIL